MHLIQKKKFIQLLILVLSLDRLLNWVNHDLENIFPNVERNYWWLQSLWLNRLWFFYSHALIKYGIYLSIFRCIAEPNNHLKCQYPNQNLWFRVDSFAVESIDIIDKSIECKHTNRYLWTKSATWQCYRFGIGTSGW